jgi:hypothetical protein
MVIPWDIGMGEICILNYPDLAPGWHSFVGSFKAISQALSCANVISV